MSFNISNIIAITLSALILSAAIHGVESTWLLERDCNGTTIANWGYYLNGDCGGTFGNPGYGTCTKSTFNTFQCNSGTTACTTCDLSGQAPLGSCNEDGNYYTCSTDQPDYSPFGPSYAVLDVYSTKDCSGSVYTSVAGVLNKCINSPVDTRQFSSVFIACSKSGQVQVTAYQQRDCQQPISDPLQATADTCTVTNVYPPFSISCYGV